MPTTRRQGGWDLRLGHRGRRRIGTVARRRAWLLRVHGGVVEARRRGVAVLWPPWVE